MLAKGGKGKGKKNKGPTQQSGNIVNPDIDCWNCGEKGHTHTQCPKKSKKKQTWSKGKGQEAHCQGTTVWITDQFRDQLRD